MDRLKKIICLIFAIVFVFAFASCGDKKADVISVNSDGYVVVNGVVTEYKVVEDNISLYELYKKNYPDYTGSEKQWIKDVLEGKINMYSNNSRTYELIKDADFSAGKVLLGSAKRDGSYFVTSNAVIKLDEKIIMPINADSTFDITVGGILMPEGGGGGHFLNSNYDAESGRVLFGCNYGAGNVFFGINILGTYCLYEWNVGQSILSSNNFYDFSFDGSELFLSMNSGEKMGFDTMSLSQGNRTDVVDNGIAGKEIMSKILALKAQMFFSFDAIGSISHKSSSKLHTLNITTSSISDYKTIDSHPLKDKVIYYLGSSITEGNGANAFDVCLRDYAGNKVSYKSAIGGTTLVTSNGTSYVERLASGHLNSGATFDFASGIVPEVLVVQMSTNDFSQNKPYGSIADSTSDDFDTTTIVGAIEYINSYIKTASPSTKVMFWTSDMKKGYSKYEQYGDFIQDYMIPLSQKWDFEIVDMYNMDFLRINGYFADDIHFTNDGYRAVCFPYMTNKLIEILGLTQ